MFIVKFQGGLGNQMFQYALYLKLESMGKEVKADINRYNESGGTIRDFLLKEVFDLVVDVAEDSEIKKLYAGRNQKVRRAIIKRLGKKSYFREPNEKMTFCKAVLDMKEGYLDGFWQSEKYFYDIGNIVRNSFVIPKDKEKVRQYNSVAIHVRMGDYLEPHYKDIYGDICTKDYYHNAISFMKTKVHNPVFYVYSDDIEMAKKMLVDEDGLEYSQSNNNGGVADDMFAMMQCDHQIIANSSYSWWAAWLNSNPNKNVVAPSKWINGIEGDDVVPETWIRL